MPTKKTTTSTTTSSNLPDFYIFWEQVGEENKSRLIQLGAAWKHKKGDGINIKLDTLPVGEFDGSLVAFPPKQR